MTTHRFDNYDFENSADWMNFKSIYPIQEQGVRAKELKMKWYKLRIDPNFNILAQSCDCLTIFQVIQISLFFLSILGLPFGNFVGFLLIFHFIEIFTLHGIPKLQIDYLKRVIFDDNTHYFLYLLVFWVVNYGILWIIPAYIGSYIYFIHILMENPLVPNSIKQIIRPHFAIEDSLFDLKIDYEVNLGYALIFLYITHNARYVILYWLYLKMRYILNRRMQLKFASDHNNYGILLNVLPRAFQDFFRNLGSICDWLIEISSHN
ncbi:unnamed protein product [Blepharisma stoltei]|uniref:Uncharacterized protein n=1 Tax=Blepharisma stoltei TaxID=1481888 RepID=A0AAU9JDH0_9CILI|nr:unnamed protein product [Blepharisma stoltei]